LYKKIIEKSENNEKLGFTTYTFYIHFQEVMDILEELRLLMIGIQRTKLNSFNSKI